MNRQIPIAVLLLLACLFTWPVNAHEMGTSAVQIEEFSPGQGRLVFKRSQSADGRLPPIDFLFQPACTVSPSGAMWQEEQEVFQYANWQCNAPLAAHQLTASGFVRLAPDLIVTARHSDGTLHSAVLTPQRNSVPLHPSGLGAAGVDAPASEGQFAQMAFYFQTGLEHLVLGPDHVLFIAALFLLWRRRGQSPMALFAQLTLFTVGHSLTLAALVLGWLVVPVQAIEAWIALSVLYLAVQLALPLHTHAGAQPNNSSHLVVITLFGLLHGLGFALSMVDKGFPADALLPTLIAFNLGIEAGQVFIVALLWGLFALLGASSQHSGRAPQYAHQALLLVTGGAALFWTFERVASYV